MKKTLLRKTIMIIFCIVMCGIIGSKKIHAASASLSASKTSVNVGDSVTINASVTGCLSQISVSGAGVSDSIDIVSSDLSNKTESKSYNLDTSKPGTYTITMKGSLVDSNRSESSVSKSVTITVAEKASNGNNTTTNNTTKNNTANDNTKTDTTKTTEPTFKSANDTMYATGDINVRKSYSADSDKIGSLKAGDKITRTGIGDNGWSKVSYNGSTGYIKTSLLTSEEPKKSDDKALKSLSIEGLEIDPAFDPEITDYSVTFDTDVEKLDIKAETNNDKAKAEITGNEGLKDGDNIIKITVTAEDGTTRLYTITATKQSANAATLSSLKISGYTLSPAFSPDVKEYKLTILDENVNKLDINAATNIENAKVEVIGNTDLRDGENVIQIKVTSPDGTTTETYKIVATKSSTGTATGNTDKSTNWILYAGIAIIAILIIAIIAIIVISRRNSYYEDDEEYDDEDEYEEENEQPDDYSDLYGYSTKSEVKNVEPDANEKEKFINESIYGNSSAKLDNEAQEEKTKYEDGFNYNAYNSKDLYGDYNTSNENKTTGIKDVDYYSNKVSEMFDNPDSGSDKASDDVFGYLPKNDAVPEAPEVNEDYSSANDNSWNDDNNYRPRRSKGKHSK